MMKMTLTEHLRRSVCSRSRHVWSCRGHTEKTTGFQMIHLQLNYTWVHAQSLKYV